MAEKRHIDEIVKEKLQNYEYEPSGDVWEGIEAELHPGTSTTETPTNSKGKFAAYTLAVLFLISFFIVYNLTEEKLQTAKQYEPAVELALKNHPVEHSKAEDINHVIENTSANTVIAAEKGILTEGPDMIVDEKSIHAKQTTENKFSNVQLESADQPVSKNMNSANESITGSTIRQLKNIATTTKPIAINTTIPVTDDPAIRSLALSPIDEKTSRYFDDYNYANEGVKQIYIKDVESYSPQINLKGMSFGVAASYNQTSVLENGNIFKGDKPIQPALKFGASKGFSMGYNFSNKFGIQADYVYNAVLGQNYVLSEDNQLVQKTLALYYNQIPVTFKLKVPRISDYTHKPVVVNYIAGLQYGMLTEYHIPQEKLYTGTEELFKKDEISFMLGVDYDIYVSSRSYFSVGARTSISNDFSTHEYPLDDYAKRNFVFGLRASYNYTFREY